MASPQSTCSSRTEYVCSHEGCYMVFTRPSRLECHVRIHTGERPYVCSVGGCHKSYSRSAHLKRHQQASHVDLSDTETFKCTHAGCEKEFGLIQNMKKHVVSTHECLKYKCTVSQCDERFRKKHQLRDHVLKHEGVSYLSCPKEGCVKQFTQKSHLHRHLKQHEGYLCKEDDCSERFDKFTLLRKHIATAHKNWYSCADCGKEFARKLFLQAHLRTHTGVMVACTYEGCPRAYYDIKNLNSHIRSYHEGKKFVCKEENCDRKFSSKQKLAEHTKLHDPTRPLPKKKPRKPSRKKKSLVTRLTGVDNKTAKRCQAQSESESEPLPIDFSMGMLNKQHMVRGRAEHSGNNHLMTESSKSASLGIAGTEQTMDANCNDWPQTARTCVNIEQQDDKEDVQVGTTSDTGDSNVTGSTKTEQQSVDLKTVTKMGAVEVC